MPGEAHSQHDEHPDCTQQLAFDYEKLQNDIVEEFILGKPKIDDNINHLRIPFKFRKPIAVTVGVGISEAVVDVLSGCLQEGLKVVC